jgi:hypothetical protein
MKKLVIGFLCLAALLSAVAVAQTTARLAQPARRAASVVPASAIPAERSASLPVGRAAVAPSVQPTIVQGQTTTAPIRTADVTARPAARVIPPAP